MQKKTKRLVADAVMVAVAIVSVVAFLVGLLGMFVSDASASVPRWKSIIACDLAVRAIDQEPAPPELPEPEDEEVGQPPGDQVGELPDVVPIETESVTLVASACAGGSCAVTESARNDPRSDYAAVHSWRPRIIRRSGPVLRRPLLRRRR